MSFGSYCYWNGIYLVPLDPATGKRITPSSPLIRLAYNRAIEASCLYQRGSYYHLFLNFDGCCPGVDSTDNIRLGRSATVTGPFLDRWNMTLPKSNTANFFRLRR